MDIKQAIKITVLTYGIDVVIYMLIEATMLACAVALWETITGRSVIDAIWDLWEKLRSIFPTKKK